MLQQSGAWHSLTLGIADAFEPFPGYIQNRFQEKMVWHELAGRTPALQACSATPNAPSFAFGFQCFQQFRGICFSLEVTPEATITWGFGTVKNQVFHDTGNAFDTTRLARWFLLRRVLRVAPRAIQSSGREARRKPLLRRDASARRRTDDRRSGPFRQPSTSKCPVGSVVTSAAH
jgi:hypothetical protein